MSHEHPDDTPHTPAEHLVEVATEVAPAWLLRITAEAGRVGGIEVDLTDPDLAAELDATVAELLGDLSALVTTDVDAQRTNPLSVFRQAVGRPTAWVLAHGARPPRGGAAGDPFVAARFPDDPFGVGPATWADIDPALHDPGIAWGASKALTILRRRRAEGQIPDPTDTTDTREPGQ